jgi:hypothetical protein
MVKLTSEALEIAFPNYAKPDSINADLKPSSPNVDSDSGLTNSQTNHGERLITTNLGLPKSLHREVRSTPWTTT